jgi:UDPglucose 6-dehydrogenase
VGRCGALTLDYPATLAVDQPQRIAVFGAGYVGLVTGACLADLGHEVAIRDVLPERIAALQRGEIPIHEPGLDELVARNADRLSFTTDVAEAIDGADVVYIAVGTPPTYSGDADLTAVWTVIDELPVIDHRVVVVMKSTVPVGTGEKIRHRLDARGMSGVGYASNPEFTAEGTAVHDFMHPDRIVVGAFETVDADTVVALHDGIDAPVVRADVASAEMIKLAANAALMTRISFINEIANVCEATGADVVKVAEGIGLDRRIGTSFLRAGVGFGGSCFPKDSLALKQLAANSGYHFQLLNAVIEVNELQKRRVVGKLLDRLGSLRGRTIALLGLAFKPNTDDTREAPALVLAGRLLAEGADVRVWDPIARLDDLHGVDEVATIEEAVAGADAVVLVTEWPELARVDWVALRPTLARGLFVDGRNFLDPAAMRAAGYEYEGVGRAAEALETPVEAPTG